jgi:hypothetical protein
MFIAIQSASSRFLLAPDRFHAVRQRKAYAAGDAADNAPCYFAAIIRRMREPNDMIVIED